MDCAEDRRERPAAHDRRGKKERAERGAVRFCFNIPNEVREPFELKRAGFPQILVAIVYDYWFPKSIEGIGLPHPLRGFGISEKSKCNTPSTNSWWSPRRARSKTAKSCLSACGCR